MAILRAVFLLGVVFLFGCASEVDWGRADAGREIIVAGEAVAIDAPVVTFRDPGGYDAYRETGFFDPSHVLPSAPAEGCDTPRRYSVRSTNGADPELVAAVAKDGWTRSNLEERIRQFVLHYDVCATSRRCFEVLHDVRGLSVHFMLDVDGTIYQTLDLAERARHAGPANDLSVGIEIAHIGAYPPGTHDWKLHYQDVQSPCWTLALPESLLPPAGGPFHPARPGLFKGSIHGVLYEMPDFTEEQYRSLHALVRTLTGVFPKMRRDCPRDPSGRVLDHALTNEDRAAFAGVLGHYHVTDQKSDPGPAMDWDRILADD